MTPNRSYNYSDGRQMTGVRHFGVIARADYLTDHCHWSPGVWVWGIDSWVMGNGVMGNLGFEWR